MDDVRRYGTLVIPNLDGRKCLTRDIVSRYTNQFLGPCFTLFDGLELDPYYEVISENAFNLGIGFEKLEIPSTIKMIQRGAFYDMHHTSELILPSGIKSITCGAFSLVNRRVIEKIVFDCKDINIDNPILFGHLGNEMERYQPTIGYKAFMKGENGKLICRDTVYVERLIYEMEECPKCCHHGFHYCIAPVECLRYYGGVYGKNFVIHEINVLGMTDYDEFYPAKRCTNRFSIGRELSLQEVFDISIGIFDYINENYTCE